MKHADLDAIYDTMVMRSSRWCRCQALDQACFHTLAVLQGDQRISHKFVLKTERGKPMVDRSCSGFHGSRQAQAHESLATDGSFRQRGLLISDDFPSGLSPRPCLRSNHSVRWRHPRGRPALHPEKAFEHEFSAKPAVWPI